MFVGPGLNPPSRATSRILIPSRSSSATVSGKSVFSLGLPSCVEAGRISPRTPVLVCSVTSANEFGYFDQLCEITANIKKGARGFILQPASEIGNPAEDTLLPDTAQQLRNLEIKLNEIMVDGAFTTTATNTALEGLADTVHIAGRQEEGSRRTRRR